MDRDYQNKYQVYDLLTRLYGRDVMDYNGLGLILWDVYEILTRRMTTLTDLERLIVALLGDGFTLQQIAGQLKQDERFVVSAMYSIVEKFVAFDKGI